MSTRRRILVVAVCLALAAAEVWALDLRGPAAGGPDRYGYRMADQSSADCVFSYVDAGSGGELLAFSPAGTAPPDDEGGAVVALAAPFEFYGAAAPAWIVSTNVYLAAAGSLALDSGGDFSNDPVLPAIPGSAPGVAARIAVWHDDASGEAGAASHRHFAVCPRPSEALGTEPCTVIGWDGWTRPGSGEPFDAQVVLYHDSFEIVLQVRPGAVPLVGGTIGIQNGAANDAAQYRPEVGLTGDTAVCLFDPRFPPGGPVADLAITNDAKTDRATADAEVVLSVGVRNLGPSPAAGAHVSVAPPPALVDCGWTCTASAGSSCGGAGSGGVDDLVSITSGGWLDYAIACRATPASGTLAAAAAVDSPAGILDPVPSNNAATAIVATEAGSVASGVGPAALRLTRVGTEVRLTWGASCRSTDVDFAVYTGPLGAFVAPEPLACSTSGALELGVPASGGDAFYLVVPTNLLFEGSYGIDGAGAERPPAPGACWPQSIGSCP